LEKINIVKTKEWGAFSGHLNYAKRWYELRELLGFGVLGLIPKLAIKETFIRRGFVDVEFAMWLRLIPHINPSVVDARRLLEPLLRRALDGKNVHRRRLYLEDAACFADHLTDPVMLLGFVEDGSASSEASTTPEPSLPVEEPTYLGDGLQSLIINPFQIFGDLPYPLP